MKNIHINAELGLIDVALLGLGLGATFGLGLKLGSYGSQKIIDIIENKHPCPEIYKDDEDITIE